MKDAPKTGIILGTLGIVSSLLIYIIDPAMFGSFMFLMFLGLINLILIVVFGIKYRKELGGYCDFRQAYIFAITAIAIMVGIRTVFSIVLFSVIDPQLEETVVEASIENMESMMMNFGASEDAIEKAIEDTKENMEGQYTPFGMFKGSITALLMNAAIALILAAIIKKKKPEFEG